MSKECKLSVNEINELLWKAPVGYLGLAKGGLPYVIPLNFIFSDGNIYFHCALEGRKVDYIKANPKACFQTGEIGGLIAAESPCKYNYSYRSVIVEGTVVEVGGNADKEAALRKLVAKYAEPTAAETVLTAKSIESVRVYRLVPDLISGKKDS